MQKLLMFQKHFHIVTDLKYPQVSFETVFHRFMEIQEHRDFVYRIKMKQAHLELCF